MPKQVNHDDRRFELAAAAVEVIADRGIENLRLVDVAKQVGATTGLVTHYLGDKDAVLRAALEFVADELVWDDADEMALASVKDVCEFLYQILPIDEARRRQWKVWLAFWSRAATHPMLAEVHKNYNVAFRSQLAKTFIHLELSGDPVALADAVLTVMDGIAAHATVEPKYWTPKRQRRQLFLALGALLENE